MELIYEDDLIVVYKRQNDWVWPSWLMCKLTGERRNMTFTDGNWELVSQIVAKEYHDSIAREDMKRVDWWNSPYW